MTKQTFKQWLVDGLQIGFFFGSLGIAVSFAIDRIVFGMIVGIILLVVAAYWIWFYPIEPEDSPV